MELVRARTALRFTCVQRYFIVHAIATWTVLVEHVIPLMLLAVADQIAHRLSRRSSGPGYAHVQVCQVCRKIPGTIQCPRVVSKMMIS